MTINSMRWPCKLLLRFRSLFRRGRVEQELSSELRFHLEKLIEERVAKGMTPEEARYAALRELGGVEQIKEECRDMRRVNYIENFLQDIRYGLRMLRKNPGFTAVAVLTLGLGIGANTAIFSVVNAVMLLPLPLKEPDRLMMLWERNLKASKWDEMGVSGPNFRDWKKQNTVFEQMATCLWSGNFQLTGGGEPEWLLGTACTANFFATVGGQPVLGRAFLAEEQIGGNHRVALISYGLWQRRFGGAKDVLKQSLTLNGETYEIVGVMPPRFEFAHLQDESLLFPLAVDSPEMNKRGSRQLWVIARLKPGIQRAQAQAEMDTIARRLANDHPRENQGWGVSVVSLHEHMTEGMKSTLLVLLGAVGFVLFIGCSNVANLLLARALARQKEFAVRTALGASRVRVIRQLLTESLLLGCGGCIVGLLFARWGVDSLMALAGQNLPRVKDVTIDGRVLGFALVVSIVAALLFGLVPAFQCSRPHRNESLKEGTRSLTGGRAHRRLRGLLAVCEIALALAVLTGAGLMINGLWRLVNADPGFKPDNLLTMEVPLTAPQAKASAARLAFYNRILAAVEKTPSVRAAALTSTLPAGNAIAIGAQFSALGQPHPGADQPGAMVRVVTPGYFRTLGVAFDAGRDFGPQDTSSAMRVAIVNEHLAKKFFGGHQAVENELAVLPEADANPRSLPPGNLTIVGVVRDIKHWCVGCNPHDDYEIYVPYSQHSLLSMVLTLHVAPNAQGTVQAVRKELLALGPETTAYKVETMREQLADAVAPRRFYPLVLGTFAAIALVLACLGIYGVMSHSVSERTHEIGIRMTLGAGRRDVLRMVVGQGMLLVLAGIGIGVMAASVLVRFLASMLYEVKPTDPMTLAVVSLVLTGVALLATYIPARRATKVDPMVALRFE